MYEFYDDLIRIAIWGGSAASEPLPFGVSSHIFTDNNESLFNEAGKSSTKSWTLSQSDGDQSQTQMSSNNRQGDETPISSRKWPAVSAVPKLIGNKIRHMEKSLSAAQRDHLLLNKAKEDKEIRKDLSDSLRESSVMFNAALQNISSSMNNFGTDICKSI